MFSKFIHRPVFAIVISITILFVGSLAIKQMPISQFPQIAPTTVNIFIAYSEACADVLVKSTLITLKNSINGVEGMRYIATDATSAGEATLRFIFEPGTDPNQAVVKVKTRVDQVMPLLPELVRREGKNLMVTNLIAEISNSYYELLALDSQLQIVNQNIEIQSNALEVVKLQKEAARVTELAVKKFEAEVLKTKAFSLKSSKKLWRLKTKSTS